jgi:hypothetical protein
MWEPQWYVNQYSRMNNESINMGILNRECHTNYIRLRPQFDISSVKLTETVLNLGLGRREKE